MRVHIFNNSWAGKQYIVGWDGTPMTWDSIELALLQIEAFYQMRSWWNLSQPSPTTWQLELAPCPEPALLTVAATPPSPADTVSIKSYTTGPPAPSWKS